MFRHAVPLPTITQHKRYTDYIEKFIAYGSKTNERTKGTKNSNKGNIRHMRHTSLPNEFTGLKRMKNFRLEREKAFQPEIIKRVVECVLTLSFRIYDGDGAVVELCTGI